MSLKLTWLYLCCTKVKVHNNEHHQNITMESDFQRHMKDGHNYDDIEMPVGMRGSG